MISRYLILTVFLTVASCTTGPTAPEPEPAPPDTTAVAPEPPSLENETELRSAGYRKAQDLAEEWGVDLPNFISRIEQENAGIALVYDEGSNAYWISPADAERYMEHWDGRVIQATITAVAGRTERIATTRGDLDVYYYILTAENTGSTRLAQWDMEGLFVYGGHETYQAQGGRAANVGPGETTTVELGWIMRASDPAFRGKQSPAFEAYYADGHDDPFILHLSASRRDAQPGDRGFNPVEFELVVPEDLDLTPLIGEQP